MKNISLFIILLFLVKINAQEIKFGKVSKEALEEKFYPLDSTAEAAYLFKKRKTYFNYDTDKGFIILTEYHERIKIYTKEGFNYASKKIPYYKPKSTEKEEVTSIKAYSFNLEKGEIIKQKLLKKNIFDEKLNKYRSQKKITFPNIKEGSVIDLKYTLTSPYWTIETLNFQFGIPVKQLHSKIEIPEYFIYNKRSKGYYSIPLKKSSKNSSINLRSKSRTEGFYVSKTSFQNSKINYNTLTSEFSKNNIPSLKDNEPYSGNINNYRGGINFELSGTKFPNSIYKSYTTTWKDVCKTIYNSSNFGKELEKVNYFKKDLTAILFDKNTNAQKINAVLNFIKSKVKWNGYYRKYTDRGVKKAYQEGSGNSAEINLMLSSMLRFAGLNANPVLVSTKNNGIPLFPTREGFNYVISKVNLLNGNHILLDATEKYSNQNTLPYRVLNWYGREILKDGVSEKLDLTTSTQTKENNILYVKIDESGSIEGMLRKSLAGYSALSYRKKNNIKKEEEIINSLEEKYKIDIEDFKLLNKEILSKPITQSLKFSGDDFIEKINNKLYFSPLFFLATNENPFKSKERTFPVDYGMPWEDKFTISITIPENYAVESFPKELAIGLPENLGVFKYKLFVQGNKVKLSSVLQMNISIITPQYYNTLRNFYTQLVKKQSEKIVLIKK